MVLRRIHKAGPLFKEQESEQQDSLISRDLPIIATTTEERGRLLNFLDTLFSGSTLEPVIISNIPFEGAVLNRSEVSDTSSILFHI